MIEKVLDVITAICDHSELLNDITKSSNEYYFRYKGHAMSLLKRTTGEEGYGRYALFVYPENRMDLQGLAHYLEHGDPENIKMASYDSKECDEEAFGRLFSILESKYLKIDDIFDHILSDDN